MVVPEDRLWLMYRLAMMAMSHTGKFGSFLASTCLARVSVPGRQRDIYPLSPMHCNDGVIAFCVEPGQGFTEASATNSGSPAVV